MIECVKRNGVTPISRLSSRCGDKVMDAALLSFLA